MGYPTIWFLRHGQTEWNAARRIQGQLESVLTEQGEWHAAQQAQIIRPVLETRPACIVSPLIRAHRTAEIALGDYPMRIDPRLMEIHAGDWQGLYYADVRARWPDIVTDESTALDMFAQAPGGEGISAFRTRIETVLSELSEPTVIVAHGLWGQVARAVLRDLNEAEMGQLDNLQGVVYHIENERETVLRAPS